MKGTAGAAEFMKQESLLEVVETNKSACSRNQDEQAAAVKSSGGTERLEMYQIQNKKWAFPAILVNFTGLFVRLWIENPQTIQWDGTEEERLVRLRDGLTRICDAARLRALIDAVVECEPSSLREAGMRFSEDGKLSFDLSALTPALRTPFEQICFGNH
ncbi:unnamed protein product [Toxocara canis]|uniref:Uncharacterized protein n=1 Tax=Toxocara canis TaxID=6265 RepID=A0A183VGH1_TOXCA|nr:unnamed protein product [Toxocara canis]